MFDSSLTDLRALVMEGMDRLTAKRGPFKDARKPQVDELRKVGRPGPRKAVLYTMPLVQNHDGKRDGVNFIFAGTNRATVRRAIHDQRSIADFRGVPPSRRRALNHRFTLAAALRAEGRRVVKGEADG